MTFISRRNFVLSALTTTTLSACGNGIGSRGASIIDSRADSTLSYMYNNYPGTSDLAGKSSGMLIMPVVTEAGLGLGASYGRGVLRIGQTTVDYYSTAAASAGLQIGAQQYSTVLFFMTQNTRFESNVMTCKHTKNNFKITYAQLKTNPIISFEKNGQTLKRLPTSNLEENSLQFENQSSNYKLDMEKLSAIETLNGETIIYKCKLEKFKM